MVERRARVLAASAVLSLVATACLGTRQDAGTTTTTSTTVPPPPTTTTTIPTASSDPLWTAARHLEESYVAAGVLTAGELAAAALEALSRATGVGLGEAEQATAGEVVPGEVPSDFGGVWRLWRFIERSRPEAASRELVEETLRAMIESTGDPNARVFADVVVEPDGFIADVYQGIGSFVQEEEGWVVITQPFPGGPAARAGIMAGDVVLAVDGVSVEGMSLSEVVARVRGPAGTPVRLLLDRPGVGPLEVEVVREDFQLSTARFRMLADGIAYLSLSGFEGRTPGELDRELEILSSQGVRGLVIDLRGNQGGRASAALAVADRFLDTGVVYQEESFDGSRVSHHAAPGGVFPELPLAILVDRGTRAEAEILAAALREHGRGPLIGTATAGQALLYSGRQVGEGLAIVVPSALWYTPSGRSVVDGGLSPDLELELTEQDVAVGQDLQLSAGFAYLWSLLQGEREGA